MTQQLIKRSISKFIYLSINFLLIFNLIKDVHARPSLLSSDSAIIGQQSDPHYDDTNSDDSDPLEGFNRIMFQIHQILDGLFFKPAAEIYDIIAHPYVKEHVHNALQNLRTPSIFINDCLQGKAENAQQSFTRFFLNTTLGVLGFYDFARDVAEIQAHQADFGQTLSVYGIKSGPYLFVPILGPTNFRDFIGMIVDFSADPVNYAIRRYSKEDVVFVRTLIDAIDQRSRLLDTIHNNIDNTYDPYISYKSLSTQNRAYNVSNGDISMDTPMPDDE